MKNMSVKTKLVILSFPLLLSLFCSRINLAPVPTISENSESPTQDIVAFTSISGDWTKSDIHIVDIDKDKQVTNNIIQQNSLIYDVRFSPDKKRLAFNYGDNNTDGLFVMDINGSNIVQITDFGYYPQWSTDGKWILFEYQTNAASGDTVNTVNAVRIDNLDIYTCPEALGYAVFRVEWIPNTHRIIYRTGGTFSSQLYECDVENKVGKFIETDGDTRVYVHYLSPDGQMIVYSEQGIQQEPSLYKVAKFTLDGIVDSKVFLEDGFGIGTTNLPSVDGTQITWSPDGQFFAVGLNYPEAVYQSDIYIYDNKGNLVKQLTDTPEWSEQHPIWLDSGKYIVVTRMPSEVGRVLNQVVSINVENGTEIIIASEPETTFFLSK